MAALLAALNIGTRLSKRLLQIAAIERRMLVEEGTSYQVNNFHGRAKGLNLRSIGG
jgi:hypothetical protein